MQGRALVLLSVVAVVGCNYRNTQEQDIVPTVEIPPTYSEGKEVPPRPVVETEDEPIRDVRWWRNMNDPTLSMLIEEALRRNQSIRGGWARVNQARYIANQVRAARMPQIALQGQYQIGKQLFAGLGEIRSQQATGSLPMTYEVDLFARYAREHKGAKFDAQAARLDQESLAITISAEVAEAWFDSINARIEVAVVAEQLETDLRFLELVELRYREGLNSAVDVHQQRQRVASQRALLAISEAQIDLTDQRLSVLLGEAPGRRFPVDGKVLPEIGPTPDVETPASLLTARPDIKALQMRVAAEDQRVGAAVGARLPSISLNFSPEYTWLNAETSVSPEEKTFGIQWTAGGIFNVPLFDGIAGWSAIKAQREVLAQLAEQYTEAILQGLIEVESALVLERQERLRIQYLEDEFRLANITLEATRDRYRAGLSDFLPVLTALATRQASELQLVASRRQLVSYRVQLYRALGGAWPEEFGEPEDE